MRLRKTIGLSLALLAAAAPAIAKQATVTHHPAPDDKAKPGKGDASTARAAARRRHAGATRRSAPAATAKATRHSAPPKTKARVVAAATVKSRAEHRREHHETLRAAARPRHADRREESAQLPPPDQYIGPVMVAGTREIGRAAWYGGRRIGRRTASGERLDAIHATAAHRSLPLYSLVKVTNLNNGRSVIATINDRGPASHSLLIDLSPRAAAALDMMHSGLANVSVVPVAPAVAAAKAH